jgi:hypothetical protein
MACLADPHHVWGHIIVLCEDHAWRDIRFTSPGLSTPGIERRSDLSACQLMVPVRLLGYVQLSVNDLVALPVVWQHCQIG